jgi:hypothetical protein
VVGAQTVRVAEFLKGDRLPGTSIIHQLAGWNAQERVVRQLQVAFAIEQ